jgi:hypothetical protein
MNHTIAAMAIAVPTVTAMAGVVVASLAVAEECGARLVVTVMGLTVMGLTLTTKADLEAVDMVLADLAAQGADHGEDHGEDHGVVLITVPAVLEDHTEALSHSI